MGGQNNISLTSGRALATKTSLANVDPATDAHGDGPATSVRAAHYQPQNRSHSHAHDKWVRLLLRAGMGCKGWFFKG